jgi:hypothetical protein
MMNDPSYRIDRVMNSSIYPVAFSSNVRNMTSRSALSPIVFRD